MIDLNAEKFKQYDPKLKKAKNANAVITKGLDPVG